MNMNFDNHNEAPRHRLPLSNSKPDDMIVTGAHETDERVEPVVRDSSINPSDVLSGRGKLSFNHAGNKRFRDLVNGSVDRYNETTTRLEKATVVNFVVEEIRASGGRFLRRDETAGAWHAFNYAQCREKTGHAIRDATCSVEARKKIKQQQEKARKNVVSAILAKNSSSQLASKSDHIGLSSRLVAGGSMGDGSGTTLRSNICTGTAIRAAQQDDVDQQQEQLRAMEGLRMSAFLQVTAQPVLLPSKKTIKNGQQQNLQSNNITATGVWRSQISSSTPKSSQTISCDTDDEQFLEYIDHVLGPLPSDAVRQNCFIDWGQS